MSSQPPPPPFNTIKILQQNLRKSITATNEVKGILESQHIDIALIQEPYCINNKVVFNSSSNILHSSKMANKRINCANIITNSNISCYLLEEFSNEFCTSTLLHTQNASVVIANFYIPPNKFNSNHSTFIETLLQAHEHKALILCGDFNARHPLWFDKTINCNANKFISIIQSNSLNIHNTNSITCQTPQGSSIIDLTITNPHAIYMVQNWENNNLVTISDHSSITFNINISVYNDNFIRDSRFSTWKYNEKSAIWSDFSKEFDSVRLPVLLDQTKRISSTDDIDNTVLS